MHGFLLIQVKGDIQVQKTVKEIHPGHNKEIWEHKQYCDQNQCGPHSAAATLVYREQSDHSADVQNVPERQMKTSTQNPQYFLRARRHSYVKIPDTQNCVWYFNIFFLFYIGDFETLCKTVPLQISSQTFSMLIALQERLLRDKPCWGQPTTNE